MNAPENHIRATGTTFRVVDAIQDLDGAGTTELATALDLPKSTVFNHLQTLDEHGYVVRVGDEYHLGLKFLDHGEYARERTLLYQVAKSEIEKLADETGEVANLMVPEHGQGVYLYKAKGNRAVNHDTRPGKRIELYCTALGKSILSRSQTTVVDDVIDRTGLEAKTQNTITDPDTLYNELETIRERGYAINTGERNERVRCVAAPIFVDGEILGSISVSGPKTRMKGEVLETDIPELVLESSNVIEINIEHRASAVQQV